MIRQTGGTAVGEISTRSRPCCGQRQGLRRGHDPQLLAVVVDHADFSNTGSAR
jgi:hypothetical protein